MTEKDCYTRDEILMMIANTLVVYVHHMENNGLVNGKTGAMLYLYRYAALSGNEQYEMFANEMLDGMMRVVHSLPSGFENGLAGFGWTINRLIVEGLVNGSPNNVLRGIDERVLGRMDCDRRAIFGQAVYMAERLCSTTPEYDLSRYAGRMLDFITNELSSAKECPTLYHLNSTLYFLSCVRHLPEARESAEKLIGILPSVYDRIEKEMTFTEQDLQINRLLTEKAGMDVELSVKAASDDNLLYGDDAEVSCFINMAWQELVYFGQLVTALPHYEKLSSFVDRKQTELSDNSLAMRYGLTGLGLALISDTASKNTTD